jgi:Phage tail assembly chaperone protein, TAC
MAQPSFTAAATRLSGLATILLGWTPDQFWAATPAELSAILSALGEMRGGADTHALPPPPDAALRAQLMEKFPDV